MDLNVERNLTSWVVPANTSALCDAIPILWQNTDIQILSLLGETITSSISIATSSSQISSVVPTATNTISSTASPSNAPSGISTGAKAAIGVTIPLFFLALILGLFIFFRQRSRPQIRPQNAHHELPATLNGGHELPDGPDWKWGHKHDLKMSELHGNGRAEADADHEIFEAYSGAVYEMDSSPRATTPRSGYSENKPSTADPLLEPKARDKIPMSKFNPRTPPPAYPK